MGGGWCNYIYEQALFPTGALKVKELGAYKDEHNRAMNFGPKAAGYDYNSCNTACAGFKFFAIQNGN